MDGEYTALTLAAENGNLDYVKLLAAHGADPGIDCSPGIAPLQLAEANNYKQIVKYLSGL
jgi:ankyrin repeat protein